MAVGSSRAESELYSSFMQRQSDKEMNLNQESVNKYDKDAMLWRCVRVTGMIAEDIQISLDNQVVNMQAGIEEALNLEILPYVVNNES